MSFTKMAAQIPTEADAYSYLEQLRWPSGVPTCPHCGHVGANFIKPRNGSTRTTTRGTQSARRLWQCKKCRKQFSAMTGTIFHGSKVPLRTWLFVLFEMCASKNGMAAREIERKYGVAPKTAWFMAHRLREAMKREAPGSLVGTNVADETWIGGHPMRMNKKSRARWEGRNAEPTPVAPGTMDVRPNQKTAKTPVVSLINAETGEVRSAVVPRVDGTNLRKYISGQVDMGRTVLWTDEASYYNELGEEFISHATVDHSADEYRGPLGQTTNRAEGYFSQLKRSIDGTHHKVSVEHLPHFDFMYSTSAMSDQQRMALLMGQVEGRRLSYKRIKG